MELREHQRKGRYSQKNWVGVCGSTSQNPWPIYDQNLLFSLPYLWPDQKFDTLYMTLVADKVALKHNFCRVFVDGVIDNDKNVASFLKNIPNLSLK